jgi:hypothetical protein
LRWIVRKNIVAGVIATIALGVANPAIPRQAVPGADWWVVAIGADGQSRAVFLIDRAGIRAGEGETLRAEMYLVELNTAMESQIEVDCKAKRMRILSSWEQRPDKRRVEHGEESWQSVVASDMLANVLTFACGTVPEGWEVRNLGEVEPIAEARALLAVLEGD